MRKAGRAGLAMAIVAGLSAFAATPTSFAAATGAVAALPTGASGLPVPRFVSLKAGRVNVRVGPGEDYKIAWVFTGRACRSRSSRNSTPGGASATSDGTVGWVFQSLLSGKRTAVVAPWASGDPRPIRSSASPEAPITAYLEPGVMGEIDRCRERLVPHLGEGLLGLDPAGPALGRLRRTKRSTEACRRATGDARRSDGSTPSALPPVRSRQAPRRSAAGPEDRPTAARRHTVLRSSRLRSSRRMTVAGLVRAAPNPRPPGSRAGTSLSASAPRVPNQNDQNWAGGLAAACLPTRRVCAAKAGASP